ncbi:hypothetical protein BM43_1646 [Burkholderia gladioli]|jgi:hypothetical protein|uniref:Uncharacterized protein n=1 Tax=Burkholderia gladioli TaxID=28095 RepID=A0AAW3F694_BURGA|nr:hypothetical protein BM43_1646 [Burkholderia gladioli]TWC68830.1 hypothetical protein FB600_110242 [Burkholderia sp. SJZ089]TWD00175.1 hypothetical protein FBX98_11015 [Burkholderia sp. SJZ115]TWD03923.1 hypothetical protein FB601_110242 [Burkholderia sp. SJZ091]KAF1063842.1 hypothetical protein LvStA_02488 [Burkholderia gladioli]
MAIEGMVEDGMRRAPGRRDVEPVCGMGKETKVPGGF